MCRLLGEQESEEGGGTITTSHPYNSGWLVLLLGSVWETRGNFNSPVDVWSYIKEPRFFVV